MGSYRVTYCDRCRKPKSEWRSVLIADPGGPGAVPRYDAITVKIRYGEFCISPLDLCPDCAARVAMYATGCNDNIPEEFLQKLDEKEAAQLEEVVETVKKLDGIQLLIETRDIVRKVMEEMRKHAEE